MPERFGRYELLRRIGAGGMAEAFVAKTFGAEGFVKEVVIKRILPAFSEDPDFVRMFINEARLAAKLQHTNIVQIYDFNHIDGMYYIAMEWVDGVDLRRVMNAARGRALPVPARVAIHVVVETLKGLHYAHTKAEVGKPLQLVHRDISPHNLLLSFAGEVKITDFGIAKAAAQASATRSGAVKGKLAYMSPEQVSGQPLDCRSDLFSLGIIFWELLAGRRLYQADSEMELYARVRKGEVPSLREVSADLPAEIEALCMRLLAFEVKERYGTAAEVLADLGRFAEVGDSLSLSEYLRHLLPAEVERDKRGETAIYGHAPGPVTALTAAPDAPTRTRFTGEERRQGKMRDQAPVPADSQPRGQADALPPGQAGSQPRGQAVGQGQATAAESYTANSNYTVIKLIGGRAGSFLLLLTCLIVFAALGWWLGLHRAAPTAPAGLADSDLAQLRVESIPPTAAIAVDGVPAGWAPVELQGRVGVELLLTAELADQAVTQHKRLGPGQQRVVLDLTAGQRSVADPPPRMTPAKVEGGSLAANLTPTSRDQPQRRDALKPSREGAQQDRRNRRPRGGSAPQQARRLVAASKASWGILDVVVSPWARVKVDGREVGQTPIKGHRLRVGLHVIELHNSELNKHEKIKVTVQEKLHTQVRREWSY